jgi:hypothetical protein
MSSFSERRAALATFLAALVAGLLLPTAARAGDAYAWTQYVASGGIEARAITEQGDCPKAAIDGRAVQMTLRAGPSDAFPVRICAIAIPGDAKEASIADRPLRLSAARVNRVLLIGDTGCRLHPLVLQNCNVLGDWPFRLVADEAAETQPEIVLHLGDLIYRELACPLAQKGCAGSPHGDVWETWKADFFDPARALLETAPIV